MRRTYSGNGPITPKNYFCICNYNLRDKTISILKQASTAPTVSVEYSLDGQRTWQSQNSGTFNVVVPAMGVVYFRANTSTWGSSASYNYFVLESNDSNCYYEFKGNIMSLLYGENFDVDNRYLTLPNTSWHFKYLFTGITASFRCESLKLPATIALKESYYRMFYNATGLTKASLKIYATTNNGSNSMDRMFEGCSNMAEGPYFRMSFSGSNTMRGMFSNCVKLSSFLYLGTNTSSQSTSSAVDMLANAGTSLSDRTIMVFIHSSVENYFGSSFWNSLTANSGVTTSVYYLQSTDFFPVEP